MVKNLFLILSAFIVTFSALVTTNHCAAGTNLEMQLKLTNEYLKASLTEPVEESKKHNPSTVNETLFWTLTDTENATEKALAEIDIHDIQTTDGVRSEVKSAIMPEENVNEHSNSNMSAVVKPDVYAEESTRQKTNSVCFPQKLNDSFQVSEKIILPRNNCNAEIAVHENRDTKLTIKFGQLQNNSYGRCCLTLRGNENSMLGVVISNIHLYRYNTQGEVLKVIIRNHHTDFFLKEYYGSKEYEPLLLTETNKVYLVLYYKVENVAASQDCTSFNLEVFTYHKDENNIHHYEENKDNYNHKDAAHANAHDIHSNKEASNFTPYIYNGSL